MGLCLDDKVRRCRHLTSVMLMVASAIFINVGRGDNVDESALVAALSNGEIAACCLDVFAEEPLQPSSPLWQVVDERILLSPVRYGLDVDAICRLVFK